MTFNRYTLDAWAILALLQGEQPAANRVREVIEAATTSEAECFLSMINLGEVFYRVGKTKGQYEAERVLELIRQLPITILTTSDESVLAAARLKMSYAISYADAFAATTAKQSHSILLTGDPELSVLTAHVQIEMLRRQR